ncbi:unnamed protein product, partial [Didymodactylos carnosus]
DDIGDGDDESISNLLDSSANNNCSLKEIVEVYKTLQQRFQVLDNRHLALIKITLDCSLVVNMLKKKDLYSTNGRRRYQELRDNLTTLFQLQERNNMILNSLIVTYVLCEPFILKANNLNEFITRLANLKNVDETSLNHIK